METNASSGSTPSSKIHPLVAAAALSIIALSAVGITSLLYNRSNATDGAPILTSQSAPSGVQTVALPSAALATSAPPGPGTVVTTRPQRQLIAASTPVAPTASTTPVTPVYNYPNTANSSAQPVAVTHCSECATVQSMRAVKSSGHGTGLGAVGGGVVGGLLGNTMGSGHGRSALTVLGVVGGALAGNQIEKSARSTTQYELTVRFEDGKTRTFKSSSPWPFAQGIQVKVVKGEVIARSAGS